MSVADPRSSGVVLSAQVQPHLAGVHHPLQGGVVVEVVVARPHVGLRGQQAERDVTAREGRLTRPRETKIEEEQKEWKNILYIVWTGWKNHIYMLQ